MRQISQIHWLVTHDLNMLFPLDLRIPEEPSSFFNQEAAWPPMQRLLLLLQWGCSINLWCGAVLVFWCSERDGWCRVCVSGIVGSEECISLGLCYVGNCAGAVICWFEAVRVWCISDV